MSKDEQQITQSADGSGGFNPKRTRAFNERMVLSLIRRHGALAKSEITRRTGLSAQAVSVIIRELEKDGFLLRGEPLKGRKGQPSIPMKLNPAGAYSFGLKLGRRSADLILIDFVGTIEKSVSLTYSYPMPEVILAFASQGIKDVMSQLLPEEQQKIAGVGIAMPFELWEWEEKIGIPTGAMEVWKSYDFTQALETNTGLPTYSQNDGTAACGAELVFGRGTEFSDFIYIYIGTLVGGGIALNNTIYAGRTSNAGAVGSIPISQNNATGKQLIDFASLYPLEQLMREKGEDPSILSQPGFDWAELGDMWESWLDQAAQHIALAIASATAIIDFPVAIIDGTLPEKVRERLVDKVRMVSRDQSWKGIELPAVLEGTLGAPARAMGAASLPLFVRYLLDQNLLFSEVQ